MVLSDLSGVTGMNIIRSIVGGERDGMRLAEFREPGCKASKETIAKSLEGTWLPEQLAILKRQLALTSGAEAWPGLSWISRTVVLRSWSGGMYKSRWPPAIWICRL